MIINTKRTLLASLVVAALSLSACSEEAAEKPTYSSDSGSGVSMPSSQQTSAADVKQPEPAPMAEPEVKVEAPAVEEVKKEAVAVKEDVKQEVKAAVEKVEAKVAESPAPAVVAGPSGAALYGSCVGCHGAAGEGGVGPKLQGQSTADVAAKLRQYKAGENVGPMTAMMAPMAQGLSDAEIDAVSEYIAGF